MGPPKFFDASLHACHALMTPAGLRNLTWRFLCVGFSVTYPMAACISTSLSGLYQTSGRCGLPYGLHGSLCTLQTFRSVRRRRLSSYGSATLGTGGWLGLTRQGLAPCKKRQACLGAHAQKVSGETAQFAVFVRSTAGLCVPYLPYLLQRTSHSNSDCVPRNGRALKTLQPLGRFATCTRFHRRHRHPSTFSQLDPLLVCAAISGTR